MRHHVQLASTIRTKDLLYYSLTLLFGSLLAYLSQSPFSKSISTLKVFVLGALLSGLLPKARRPSRQRGLGQSPRNRRDFEHFKLFKNVRLPGSQNVLHVGLKCSKSRRFQGLRPRPRWGSVRRSPESLVVRGFLPSATAASRLRRLTLL